MIKLHKEGKVSIFISIIFCLTLIYISKFVYLEGIKYLLQGIGFFVLIIVLQFFRKPNRKIITDINHIISPADGKIVVIEKVFEEEYFKKKCIQISIFMSPFNVHINWNSISGIIKYFKYHPGKYLFAWNPKASTKNERTTFCIQRNDGIEIVLRQIAGAFARRIVWYVKGNQEVKQGNEFGFIKFGSRVDLFLPSNSEILVEIGDKVKGMQTKIAKIVK